MATLKQGKQGTSMQGLEESPARRKRGAKRRKRQEGRWAARSGEATTRTIDDLTDDERRRLGL